MQTLMIKVDDYVDSMIDLLKKIPKNKIKIFKAKENTDTKVFGLLQNRIKNSVQWQKDMRSENDRDIYSEMK